MTDFDNGMPPANTNVTDNRINGVAISKSDSESMRVRSVSGVTISKSEDHSQDIRKISAVLISTEPAGKNTAMFL